MTVQTGSATTNEKTTDSSFSPLHVIIDMRTLRDFLVCLILLLAVTSTILVSSSKNDDDEREVILLVDRTDNGLMTVELRVGTPPRSVIVMLDMQSDVSGLWADDMMRGSMSFCEQCRPVTRDYVYFGPYFFWMELRSIVNEAEVAMSAQRAPAWAPPYPSQPPDLFGGDPIPIRGWLAMSPRSELRHFWNHIVLNRDTLTLKRWTDRNVMSLSDTHRSFPNVLLAMHPQHWFWHEGWLVKPDYDASRFAHQPRNRYAEQLELLTRYAMQNASFVLFGNTSKTMLAQRYYNQLFFGANVYQIDTLPARVQLAPGLHIAREEWFREQPITHIRWVDVEPLSPDVALAKLHDHPIDGTAPDDVNILGFGLLNRFELRLNTMTDEIALVQRLGNDHLSTGQLFLFLALFYIFVFLFLVRSVYLRPLEFSAQAEERRYNREKHWLTIGFHGNGYWWLVLAQFISVGLQLGTYWSSEKLPDMRRSDSERAVAIFWLFTLFVNISCLLELLNAVLMAFSAPLLGFGSVELDFERERYLARMFVLTQTLHVQSALACCWILLMDRTSRDITNLAASLFTLFMIFIAAFQFFVLMDRIFHRAKNAEAQLWPAANTPTRTGGGGGSPTKPHQFLNVPLTYHYVVFVLLWTGAWLVWLGVFSSWLQLYEQLRITMSSVTRYSLVLLSITIVMFVVSYGVSTARIIAQVNHIREFADDATTT